MRLSKAALPAPHPPPYCSAERFATQYRDPGRRKEFRLEARKERLAGEGFITGIDMFSEVRLGTAWEQGSGGAAGARMAQEGWRLQLGARPDSTPLSSCFGPLSAPSHSIHVTKG